MVLMQVHVTCFGLAVTSIRNDTLQSTDMITLVCMKHIRLYCMCYCWQSLCCYWNVAGQWGAVNCSMLPHYGGQVGKGSRHIWTVHVENNSMCSFFWYLNLGLLNVDISLPRAVHSFHYNLVLVHVTYFSLAVTSVRNNTLQSVDMRTIVCMI